MALKIEYETNFGITCDYAHCVIVTTRCNKEVDEDEMFALKIALFEIDKIKDSKNLDGKKALRKCKTRIDLLKSALNLYSEE